MFGWHTSRQIQLTSFPGKSELLDAFVFKRACCLFPTPGNEMVKRKSTWMTHCFLSSPDKCCLSLINGDNLWLMMVNIWLIYGECRGDHFSHLNIFGGFSFGAGESYGQVQIGSELASLPMLASLLQSEPLGHTWANMSLFHFTVAIVIFSNHGLVPAVDFLAFAEQFCTNEKP
jgi:hypothetical protein